MKKRLLSLFLALTLACSLLVFPANAAEVLDSGSYENGSSKFEWVLTSDGTVTISGTGIIDSSLKDCWSDWDELVKNIVIEPGVTQLGMAAFNNCKNLETITIPETVTRLGRDAFSLCYKLKSVTIPSSVTVIDNNAFQNCSNLTSVTIPEGVETIGQYAFINCKSLKAITIPRSVTEIGEEAFEYCERLTDVVILSEVLTLNHSIFKDCTSLENVTLPDNLDSIGENMFSGCRSLIGLTIPESVSSIGQGAFYECSSLSNVKIPKSVATIGAAAFYNCSSLASVTIPENVISIGTHAFYGCNGMEEINVESDNSKYQSIDGVLFNRSGTKLIVCPAGKNGDYEVPEGVLVLTEQAFANCTSITNIAIPEGVVTIGESAFYKCYGLERVTIPASVTSISNSTFDNCVSLKCVTIPDSITNISNYAFHDCYDLKDVYYGGNADQWAAISIGSYNDGLTNATIHFGASTPGRIESKPADVTALAGESVSFSVTASGNVVSYQWQVRTPGGEWTNCDGNAATLAFTAYDSMNGNQYRCVITDQDGNSVSSNFAVLTVAQPVTITGSPIDSVGKLGGIAAFAVEAEGEGLSYQWQFSDDGGENWSNSSVTAQVYTTKLTAARDGRMVRCVVTDRFGYSAISGTAKMCTELKTLLITAHPVNVEGKANATVSFRVTAVGEGLSYQWQISDTGGEKWSSSSVKSAVYSTKLTSGRDGRLVRCIVTDQYGNTAISESAMMWIKEPLVITKLPENYVGKVYSTASFTVVAEGSGLSYQWQYSDNGTKWSNSSVKAAVYSTKLTAARDGRMVRCVITDRNGNSVTSASASMRIG